MNFLDELVCQFGWMALLVAPPFILPRMLPRLMATGTTMVISGFVYCQLPVDLIPDVIPGVGKLDDTVAVVVMVLGMFITFIAYNSDTCPVTASHLDNYIARFLSSLVALLSDLVTLLRGLAAGVLNQMAATPMDVGN